MLRIAAIITIAFAGLLGLHQSAHAFTYTYTLTVNTTADTSAVNPVVNWLDSSGKTSLRSAIQYASSGILSPTDLVIVNLPANHYYLSSGIESSDAAVKLLGASAGTTIIDGTHAGVFPLINTDVPLTVNKVTFTRAQGGGLSAYNGGSLTLNNDVFSFNGPDGFGGAIHLASTTGTVTVTGSTFTHNSSEFGGAIYAAGGTVNIASSTFINNSATTEVGGGLYINGADVTVTLSTFKANTAGNEGGAIDHDKGTLNVSKSLFTGNFGENYCGGICNDAPGMTVSSSRFISNSTAGYAGAVYSDGGSIAGSTFLRNTADTTAAIYVNAPTTLNGNIVIANTAKYCPSVTDADGTFITGSNNVVAGNIPSNGGAGATCT